MLSKDEEHLLINRINDLSKAADKRHNYQSSEFLDMTEASRARSYLESLKRPYKMYGGYDEAERQIAIIYPEFGQDDSQELLPVSFVHISPKTNRYLKKPTHRDYLGALMNLGLERRVLGDILILEAGAIVVCLSHIEAYIVANLTMIGQSEVMVEVLDQLDASHYKRAYKEIKNTVASLRLDSIVKVCSNLSRSDSVTMIRSGKVFINGREVTKSSFTIEEGQILSIRGTGKFRISHVGRRTKKDRIIVEIDKYI